jgi:hypothetical protein
MSYRALVALPFVCVALAAAILALVPLESRPIALRVVAEVVKTLAFLGPAAGALVFDRSDYLRRGWGLVAACYVCLLTRDAWLILSPGDAFMGVQIARGLLVAVANTCMVVGTWTLARAWQVAGLEHPASPTARRLAIAVAVLASLLFAGPGLVVDLRDTLSGHPGDFWMVASDLGDLLALPVLAPVVMTAFAVKDGTLRWPWGLLAASLAAWLLYDAVLTVPEVLGMADEGIYRVVADCFRVFAATSVCAAGLAQRRAMLELDA